MIREKDIEPKVKDENLSEEKDMVEDWTEIEPYENIEKEIFHSTLNKTTNIINDETELKKEKLDKNEVTDNIEKMRRLSFEDDVEVRRAFTIRTSTYRKMNELKNIHPDIKISLNILADNAFNYYYEYIKNGGEF